MFDTLLKDLRVLDLTQNVAGPFCTQILGDLGAEIIKIERPGTGDDTRAWRPPELDGHSSTFLALNRNKRSICIDLATPEGQDRAFRKLDSIRHELVWFDSWSQAPQLLNDGGAVFVQSANGRFFDAIRREKKPFTIVWDGHLYDLDAWGIVKGTPKLKQALEFVAFTTTTKALAGFQDVAYGPPRHSSMAQVDKEVVDHLPTAHIDVGLKANGIFWADYGENLGERFNEWLLKQ